MPARAASAGTGRTVRGRPRTLPRMDSSSVGVRDCGPLNSYAAPACSSLVRARAAISARSAGSMLAAGRSAKGMATSSPARSCPAHCRAFDMKRPGRSRVHAQARDGSVTADSASVCQRAITSEPEPASSTDSFTTRRTPAFAAACARAWSWVGPGAVPTPCADIRNAPRAPANAASRLAGSSASPYTASTPSGSRASAGRRVIARTGSPAAASRRTSSPPTCPVAPVTRIIALSSRRWLVDVSPMSHRWLVDAPSLRAPVVRGIAPVEAPGLLPGE